MDCWFRGDVGIGIDAPTHKVHVVGGILATSSITASEFYGDGSNLTGIDFSIGDDYGGGKIFWVDAKGQHALISATADQSVGIAWGNNTDYTGAQFSAVYGGMANTVMISTMQGAGSYAAQLCQDYAVNVSGVYYDDWYLPSLSEVSLLHAQKAVVGNFDTGGAWYMSSTEKATNTLLAKIVRFSDGIVGDMTKTSTDVKLRCIRSDSVIGAPVDNLGNHIAMQNLKLNGKWVSNDGGDEGIRVLDDGNVGIGTVSPTHKLHVDGGILATSSITATGDINAAKYQINGNTVLALLSPVAWNSFGVGVNAGRINSGGQNSFIGFESGYSNTGGTNNTFVGYYSGRGSTGWGNSFLGAHVARYNTSGAHNSYFGSFAGYYNVTGSNNVIFGDSAGKGASGNSYSDSTLIGYNAGYNLRTGGNNNVLLGFQAGNSLTTGASNIIIGYDEDAPTATTSNHLNIGGAIFGNLSTGDIGIGTATVHSTSNLHIYDSAGAELRLGGLSGTESQIVFEEDDQDNNFIIRYDGDVNALYMGQGDIRGGEIPEDIHMTIRRTS